VASIIVTARERRIRSVREEYASGALEMVYGGPHPHLRAQVLTYCGYAERTGRPARRRELPWPGVVLIFDFGPTLRILDPFDETVAGTHAAGFVAGLHDVCALTETSGAQSGVQVNLTPLGARQLFGVPMAELAHRVVGIEDVLGAAGRRLTAAPHDAPGWAARFDLLDAIIGRRVATAAALSPLAAAGWRRLKETGGELGIGALAAELECSRKHLITIFRDQIGLAPKTVARVLRFQRAIRLHDGGRANWTDVAYACGYADQAHFIKDFRRFAGVTPSAFRAARQPGEGAAATA
jgi:AraC-like DNA-binding protein